MGYVTRTGQYAIITKRSLHLEARSDVLETGVDRYRHDCQQRLWRYELAILIWLEQSIRLSD